MCDWGGGPVVVVREQYAHVSSSRGDVDIDFDFAILAVFAELALDTIDAEYAVAATGGCRSRRVRGRGRYRTVRR